MSKAFENAIGAFLKKEADSDSLFRLKLESHPEKDITAVCSYIVAEVAKLVSDKGAGGFTDEEIYGMAKHFIDEDDLKPEQFRGKVKIVTNKHIELSSDEIERAKAVAIEEYKLKVKKDEARAAKERARKQAECKQAAAEKKRHEAEEKARKWKQMQPSLFDNL